MCGERERLRVRGAARGRYRSVELRLRPGGDTDPQPSSRGAAGARQPFEHLPQPDPGGRLSLPPPLGSKDEPEVYYPTGTRNFLRLPARDDLQGVALAVLARRLGLKGVYLLHDPFWGGTPGAAISQSGVPAGGHGRGIGGLRSEGQELRRARGQGRALRGRGRPHRGRRFLRQRQAGQGPAGAPGPEGHHHGGRRVRADPRPAPTRRPGRSRGVRGHVGPAARRRRPDAGRKSASHAISARRRTESSPCTRHRRRRLSCRRSLAPTGPAPPFSASCGRSR